MLTIVNIMTNNVISVPPDMALTDAVKIIMDHSFHGVPVTDRNNKLIGILTEYDLVSKASALHLPTMQYVLESAAGLKQNEGELQQKIEELRALRVKDIMNQEPLTFKETDTYEQAVITFRSHHKVNPVPVVDADGRVVGVVSRFDILKPFSLCVPGVVQ